MGAADSAAAGLVAAGSGELAESVAGLRYVAAPNLTVDFPVDAALNCCIAAWIPSAGSGVTDPPGAAEGVPGEVPGRPVAGRLAIWVP